VEGLRGDSPPRGGILGARVLASTFSETALGLQNNKTNQLDSRPSAKLRTFLRCCRRVTC